LGTDGTVSEYLRVYIVQSHPLINSIITPVEQVDR